MICFNPICPIFEDLHRIAFAIIKRRGFRVWVMQSTIWDHRVDLVNSRGPFYLHGLTLITTWISNHMPSKVWVEITFQFLNFNGCTVEL